MIRRDGMGPGCQSEQQIGGWAAMTSLANERVAYFNGRIVPESDVLIPFRDRGFIAGDAAFDTARSFKHRIFRLKEHIDRLYRSLRYLKIDPGLTPQEMTAITEDVFARNRHLLDQDEDYWVSQRISRGVPADDLTVNSEARPTVIVECKPLPLKQRATLFRDGIEVVVPSVRRAAPDMLSPRAKTHNYLNLTMGDLEARERNPNGWAILLDADGNIAEGTGSNFFMVRDGVVMTPQSRYVLPGVSRAVTLELAEKLKIPHEERDIDLYDAYTADEAFLTSTSLCICPVRSINGRAVAATAIPGPVTKRLIDAYAELVGMDFVGQYLRRIGR
jgi:branched-chain amino acid aminotransferase